MEAMAPGQRVALGSAQSRNPSDAVGVVVDGQGTTGAKKVGKSRQHPGAGRDMKKCREVRVWDSGGGELGTRAGDGAVASGRRWGRHDHKEVGSLRSNYRVNPAAGVTAVASATVRSPAAGYAER
jgi:hypothetical protein